MSEIRKDPITSRWVIVSPEFRQQPLAAAALPAQTRSACPFCAGNEALTPHDIFTLRPADAKPDAKDWKLRVIPNKFPVLRVEGALDPQGEGLYDKCNGIGANEVIIESPDHEQDFDSLALEQIEDIFWTLRERFMDLRKDVRIHYIQVFKSRGEPAGANLSHPHLQLIGLPMTPKAVLEKMAGVQRHQADHGRCIYCDILRQDLRRPERLVVENDRFAVLTPYASRFPFETWLLPKQHAADFSHLAKADLKSLAQILRDLFRRLKKVLKDPPYNLLLNTAPLQAPPQADFHWHLEILPRFSRISGFEWGTDFFINSTPPEEAARFLREAAV